MANLDQIEAKFAITEVKARYCRFLDTKDWEGFAGLMADDFVFHMDGTSLPIIHGREAAVKQVIASVGTAKTAHQVHTPEFQFVSPDEAHVIWPMQDRVIWPDKALTGYGHYHVRYVRQGGQWKIAATKLTRLIMERGAAA
jgi:ketosteroid isomerase-like protein